MISSSCLRITVFPFHSCLGHSSLSLELGNPLLGTIDNHILIVDGQHTRVLVHSLSPLVKVGSLLLKSREKAGGDETVLAQGEEADDKGRDDCLLLC